MLVVCNEIILLPKGDPTDLSKVRPITLSTALDKIIAKLIVHRIGRLLRQHPVLHPANVGFIPEGETHDLILPLQMAFDITQASTWPDAPSPLHALQIDWSGAFDRTPWALTDAILTHLNFSPQLLTWLKMERQHSDTHLKFPQGVDPQPMFKTTRGTKQGSALSPIIFAITNDLLVKWLAQTTQGTNIGTPRLHGIRR